MLTRSAVGWAILFAVPPGIGVTGYAAMLTDEGLIGPISLAAGAMTAAVIFGLVLVSQLTGSPEPEAVRERVD